MNRIRFAAPWSMLLLGVVLNLGCGDRSQNYRSPTAPGLAATPAPVPVEPEPAVWLGDQTPLSISGPCVSHTLGWTRTNVRWLVDIRGNHFEFLEDPGNDDIVYTGTLEGDAFSAAYHQSVNQPCQFREASIKGSLSSDRRAFDAEEVWTWGAPGSEETRFVSRWHVTTIP